MPDPVWAGGDFQQPPRTDGGVALCGSCRNRGECRLGLSIERLDSAGDAHFLVTCPPYYEGGPGVAHGGWTAEVLDETLGHLPIANGQLSVTATLTITYVKPVPTERQLEVTAWTDSVEGRKWRISGELRLASSGAVLARATGVWVARDSAAHFGGFQQWLADQSRG